MSGHAVDRWREITQPTATPARRSSSLAWWGMVWVVATEATLFGVLLSSYFWIRWQTDGGWPPAGLAEPELLLPTLFTGALLLSALTMALAGRGVRRGRTGVLTAGLLATLALAGAYGVLQTLDWLAKLEHFTPRDNAYGALVYTITGAHAAHVALGMLFLLWVQVRAWQGAYAPHRHVGVQVAGLYWYFVIVVAAAVYLSLTVSPYI